MIKIILALIAGALIGGFIVFRFVIGTFEEGMGNAFGWPSKPWWKFW